MMRSTNAFTLIEVALALALITLAVGSTMLLFPVGLKAQQLARFGLYAAMKAEEIAELAAAAPNDNTNIDSEAFQPWDVPIGYRVLAPDIEARVASPPYGIMPLPLTIARRIDSDGDEIAGVLDSGAQLYYSQATPVGQLREDVIRAVVDTPPSDVQRLVFAVIGSPQQNAIFSFPWKAWPYYAHYPSPPMHGAFLPGQYAALNAFEFTWPVIDRNALFEGAVPSLGIADGVDADIRVVFEHHEHDLRYGYKPYAYDPDGGAPTRDGAVRYVQAALWYCIRKGLPKAYWDPSSTTPLTDFDANVPRWQQVDATRFLAHATACMTRWCDLAELGSQPSTDAAGFLIPTVTLAGVTVPALRLTHDEVVFHHETCLNLAMRYAAEDPYDWGAPRPIQRAIMTDYPLMQWDLFSPPLSGTIFETGEGVGTVPAEQWR
ncbi:MAG: hypothetical protein H0X45_09580, partial [Planctomycetes bacterium]|nr:hypothetical protein [Planctomycetota bacterium]